jgi:uncharacterized protein
MSVRDIKTQYKSADAAEFPDRAKLLLICVNKTIGRVLEGKLTLLDAVRYSWVLSPERAEQADYMLAVAHGLILGAYVAETWLEANKRNFPDISDDHGNWTSQKRRYGFRGRKASDDIWSRYVGQRVPNNYRNHGSPIRFVHC